MPRPAADTAEPPPARLQDDQSETVCTRRPGARDTACRCSADCRELAAAAKRFRDHRRRQGISGRVPATQVQARIDDFFRLLPSASLLDLASAAHLSPQSLSLIRHAQPERTVRFTTAQQIESAVQSHLGRLVDSTGAVRRIEALLAQGWPLDTLADFARCGPDHLRSDRLTPTAPERVVTSIELVFSTLRYRSGPSDEVRAEAAALGYLPWPCWGVHLDDPSAVPTLSDQDQVRVHAFQMRSHAAA